MTGRTAIGWSVIEPAQLKTCHVDVDGGTVVLHVRPGATCEILMDLVKQFDATVERLELPGPEDEWSYAKRMVRQSSNIWSEHSGGTALDLNSTRHPRGVRNTFSTAQVRAIDALLKRYEGVIAWGGRFRSVVDEMHFEVTVPPGDPRIQRVAEKIRMEMEDDMPTAQEIADAVYQTFTHKTFTKDEGGEQLDNRAPVQIALVGSRAALTTQDIAKRVLTAIGELSKQVTAIAVAVADDATKAQVQEIGDKVDQLLAELPIDEPTPPAA